MFTPINSLAQTSTASIANTSCREFVQQFYAWYVPRVNTPKANAESDALQDKESAFGSKLYRALKDDFDAQARSRKIVGLDFDPFLDTQAPDSEYVIGQAEASEGKCFVYVYGLSLGKRNGKPAVQPELARSKERWVFVNFHYESQWPEDENLLSILKMLKADRQRHPGPTVNSSNR